MPGDRHRCDGASRDADSGCPRAQRVTGIARRPDITGGCGWPASVELTRRLDAPAGGCEALQKAQPGGATVMMAASVVGSGGDAPKPNWNSAELGGPAKNRRFMHAAPFAEG
jgi:hypothetical protein